MRVLKEPLQKNHPSARFKRPIDLIFCVRSHEVSSLSKKKKKKKTKTSLIGLANVLMEIEDFKSMNLAIFKLFFGEILDFLLLSAIFCQ